MAAKQSLDLRHRSVFSRKMGRMPIIQHDGVIEQRPHVPSPSGPQLQKGLHPSPAGFGEKLEKPEFVIVHRRLLIPPPPAQPAPPATGRGR